MTAQVVRPGTSPSIDPPDAGTAGSPPVLLRVLGALLFLVAAVAVQLLRIPGVPAWDSLQAEDGGIFYTDALNEPLVSTIGQAYEGYLHVVPRLIGATASLFGMPHAALVINTGASLVVALLALYVFAASRDVLPSVWGRSLLVVLFVALPAAGYEANASVNNLHWYLNFACFWVFLSRPRHRAEVAAGTVVAAAAVLSDPLAALLLPLVAYRAWQALKQRDGIRRSALAPAVVFVVGLALQTLYAIVETRPRNFVEVDWREIPGTYGLRIGGSLFVGDRWLNSVFAELGHAFVYLCLALAVVAGVAAYRAAGTRRRIVAVMLAYSAVFLAVPLLIRGTSIYLDRSDPTLDGSRYMIVPSLLLACGLFVALFGRPRSNRILVGRIGVTVLLLAVIAASYRMSSSRSDGPGWDSSLRAAEQRCASGGAGANASSAPSRPLMPLEPGQVAIPTAPGQPDLSVWNVIVDCDRLPAVG